MTPALLRMHPPEKPTLILASASPRRQELLREAGIEFMVDAANINEDQRPGELPLEYASRLASEKAQAVARRHPQSFVLGADTIVVLDGEILGKPRDTADATRMLHLLSGRSHHVTTAVCLMAPTQDVVVRTCTTQVHFRELTEDEMQRYVAGGEPMDKAGAYAIQGGASRWADRIVGDYSNVVGLPLSLVTEILRSKGLRK